MTRSRLLLTLLVPACTMAPLNGTTVTGNVVGKTMLFQGFYDTPDTLIRLDVLKDPTLDPDINANWVQFATATTGDDPLDVNDPANPLYLWEVTAAPVPNVAAAARWPQGGLARVRAIRPNAPVGDGRLTVFDAVTFDDCRTEQLAQGATWAQLGVACEGTGGKVATLVSTTNVPTGGALGFLGKKLDITVAETEQYYAEIEAPATLAQFKAKYGFVGAEIQATYYNDGDLGLGREMHCKAHGNGGIACYVVNYSGIAGQAVFDQSPGAVLADAIAKQDPLATVAMVYDPPAGAPNSVKFMVYDAAGARSPTAQLDSTGAHVSVPKNCMACHGINSTYDPGNDAVSGAQFLPFDPFSFKYAAQAGFTQADQAHELRQLNGLVSLTSPSAGIAEYITGLYAPKFVSDPTAVANPDYVPDDWADALPGLDGTAIYQGVVRVGCRTCHMSASIPQLDFADAADFTAFEPAIRADVCGAQHSMPHAERVMKKFWQSGARAYLTSVYASGAYPDALQACKP